MMIETHPFKPFQPDNARYLILGSFAAKEAFETNTSFDPAYDWYYGTPRNQLWLILEAVYGVTLKTKSERQALFENLGIAIADIILQCRRKNGTSMDSNLEIIAYNREGIAALLERHRIEKIFFTSRFVQQKFDKEFREVIAQHPQIERITLPSPSPRYARMTRAQKVEVYKQHLPALDMPA